LALTLPLPAKADVRGEDNSRMNTALMMLV